MSQPAIENWTYGSDPSGSERDELRFLVQDTDKEFRLLADSECDYLLEVWMPRVDSVIFVASVAAAVIARKFTSIVSVSADGVSVSTADLAQRYRDMAASLREEYKASGAASEVDMANVMVSHRPDAAVRPLVFGMRLHDNPAAGQQDYGGWSFDPFALAEEIAAGWYG